MTKHQPDYAAMLPVALSEAKQGLAEGGIPVGAAIFDRNGRLSPRRKLHGKASCFTPTFC